MTERSLIAMLLLFSSLMACHNSSGEQSVAIKVDEMPPWENKIPYTEKIDYMRNLDFSILDVDSINGNGRTLMLVLQAALDEKEEVAIEKMKEAFAKEEDPGLKNLYAHMINEFLNNQGKYKEAVEFFELESPDITVTLSKFPEEEFIPLNQPFSNRLSRRESGHAELAMEINGKPIEMILDTGADWTLLSESRAKEFGVILASEQHDLHTSTDIVVKTQFGYLEEVKVGEVLIKNLHVLVVSDELTTIEKDDQVFDAGAVFGWNAIRNLKVVLDDRSKTYEATVAKYENVQNKNFFWLGYPGLKVVAKNGQGLSFGFDSGAGATEIRPLLLSKFPDLKVRKDSTFEAGIGGIEEKVVDVIDRFDLYLSNHLYQFISLEALADDDFVFINQDGTIGIDILQNNRVTFNYKNKQLLIETDY